MSATPTTAATAASSTGTAVAKVVIPFAHAVRQVFSRMAGVQTSVGTPHLKSHPVSTYNICGIIGFSGQLTGSVVLSLSDAAGDKLVEAFAGSKVDRTSPDFADAVGELANMVAGCAKQQMAPGTSISLPSVVIGQGYTIANGSLPCIVIPCSSPLGEFSVEVCIKETPSPT